MSEQQIVKTLLAPFRLSSQRCDQRTMDAASEALCHSAAEQGGDIGEAKKPALLPGDGLFKKTCRSPSTPGTGQQGTRIVSGQITDAFAVTTCQVTPATFHAGRDVHAQPPRLEHGNSSEQAGLIADRRARCGNADPVARLQGTRQCP